MKLPYLIFIIGLTAVLYSCTKELNDSELIKDQPEYRSAPDLPNPPYVYEFDERTTPAFVKVNKSDMVSDEMSVLGRVLFYDRSLSIDNSVSCGSCHRQEKGFADDRKFSKGVYGAFTERNTLAFSNMLANKYNFWDGRDSNLTTAVLQPILNRREMGMHSLTDLIEKLKLKDYYGPLFYEAYGSTEISEVKIGKALASFIGAMASMMSKRDKVYFGWVEFTEQEFNGMQLFKDFNCYNCHLGFNSGNVPSLKWGFADNRLDPAGHDQGRNGQFKIPTLRNIELTAPYMHDGRFGTLEEVLDHYRSMDNVDLYVERRLGPGSFGEYFMKDMTDEEADAIIAYIRTFTDHELPTDPRFSNPFL